MDGAQVATAMIRKGLRNNLRFNMKLATGIVCFIIRDDTFAMPVRQTRVGKKPTATGFAICHGLQPVQTGSKR